MGKTLILVISLLIAFPAIMFSQKIYMVGDSHVAGRIYPQEVERELRQALPDMDFSYFGKNGATYKSFVETPDYMNAIIRENPYLLIVHLGTNDSYTANFNKKRFLENLTEFYDRIHPQLPDCSFAFVTPFFNKLRKSGGEINESNSECAEVLREFAEVHDKCYVINNNAEYGMTFVEDDDLIKPDNVHLTHEGYRVLGKQVAQNIIEIYELWDLFQPPAEDDEEMDF